jgi:hypothetical protein
VSSPERRSAAGLSLLLLAACASVPPAPVTASVAAPVGAPIDTPRDASLDWHPLILMPFGTLLKDTKVRLHEVLLFHEDPHPADAMDSDDCYAIDGSAPDFAGTPPDEYLICFDHDRMDRIDARVLLAADEAGRVFGRACDRWLENATVLTKSDDLCRGRDGDVAFSGRLTLVTGGRTAEVLIRLSNAGGRDAEWAPP